MTTAKIGFSNSTSLFSKLIRFFTRSKISHSWLLLDDLVPGVDLVMEAVPGDFQIITYEKFKRENSIVEVIDLGIPLTEAGTLQAFGWSGRGYDYLVSLGMLYVLIGRVFGRKWKNPFATKAMNCVESIVYFLRALDFPGSHELDPGVISPKDLYDFLKRQ